MLEPLQVLYNVNGIGNPFHPSVYEFPPPNTMEITHHPSRPPVPILQQVADLFRSRNAVPVPTPMKTSKAFGNVMLPLSPDTTRLYFINLNGLNLQNNSVKFRELCEELHKSEVHLFAAAEHNLDTHKFAVRQCLQYTARKGFQHHCIQTATSSTLATKFYKSGGTMIMAQGDIVGWIKDRGSDSLGRWSWIKLVGQNNCLFTLISAYQVCLRPTNGSSTPTYHQQESLLHQRGNKKSKTEKILSTRPARMQDT
jgi:hypothetical protein